METIATQFRQLYAKADEDERRKFLDELQDLQLSMDDDWDTILRLGSGFLQFSLVAIGTDLGVYEALSNSQDVVTLDHFVSQTGASRGLLGHILRTQAAFGQIEEAGQDNFRANRMTKMLAKPNIAGGVYHGLTVHGGTALALPSYLKARKYQDITSNRHLAFHDAMSTDLPPFEWMKQRPEQMKSLGHAMATQRTLYWVTDYPVENEVGSFSPAPDSALLVDIGGGFGQQAVAFKQNFGNIPGRIIVQDIQQTLDSAPAVEGIEFMVQDFFQPQAIKGAKFYYLRAIMHDWPDAECVKILRNIVPAMGPESRIIIDDVVMPDTNVPWQAAYMSLTMMGCLGSLERTKAEFTALLDQAGLKIVDIHKYDSRLNSVILAAPQ
ncbi:S-adenosyl-L-methionine-dependent methyltransferase [Polyplosphaeria fusca]|uniref:S-adenosyl-L-methionine-dependent methyltransferase n=1 Tax=Polyplosphaeria fusca TaxID=682080 RepID=A0A9P4R4S8_9PLEO|nr:S-adenosyl-L-methionine-dependent methyltransferase [Polyplosphaeria fusca]